MKRGRITIEIGFDMEDRGFFSELDHWKRWFERRFHLLNSTSGYNVDIKVVSAEEEM